MTTFEISFIIACCNAGMFLREAVASIQRQTGHFAIADIIVVDDRSDDTVTQDVLRKTAELDRVRVFPNTGARGAASAPNTGIAHVRGNRIAFMDADDILPEGSLELHCRTASALPDCKWISADYRVLREDGTVEEKSFYWFFCTWRLAELLRIFIRMLAEPIRLPQIA
ncbi:MAG: glycosyltransferase family A protein [Alphaproteobacteria bacterium]